MNDARLAPGDPIFLGGSFVPTARLKDGWVEPPAQECLTARTWIAWAIDGR